MVFCKTRFSFRAVFGRYCLAKHRVLKGAVPGQNSLPIQPDSTLQAIRFAVDPPPMIALICGLVWHIFLPVVHMEIFAGNSKGIA